jgi:hypothetical protein
MTLTREEHEELAKLGVLVFRERTPAQRVHVVLSVSERMAEAIAANSNNVRVAAMDADGVFLIERAGDAGKLAA